MSTEAKAPETKPQPAKANGYKFKRGDKEVMHPFFGLLTNEELKNPVVIAGIKRLDAKGETTDFFGTNIEPA